MKRTSSTSSGMSGEIEQVVTKLLRTTKALLEALTQWSNMRASNAEIFEIHDTLEKQFFLVSQAFEEAGVSMNDLQWIPRQLRESVSIAMMEQPSPAALDQYLPRIREVIVHLLHGLKGKQAQLREKDRESRASIRSSSNSDAWNREVPLAALNRGSSTSSNGSQRMMMYPNNSPPLPPMSSPRMNGAEYDTWSGGMPRPSVPTNDLSARIMPKRPYSPPPPPHGSPMMPLPTRSTSSSRQHIPNPPPPPPAPPSNNVNNQPQTFDENDPNTASALAALKRQENLARRSSVRRASMYRGNSDYYTSISSRMQDTPPVPALPKSQLARAVPEEPEESHEEEEKGLTLFLQIGKQVKKTVYQGEISIPALNMLFVEKFNYTSRQNDFPNIYIRDPSIGVSYELTDLSEVKDKSVLSLNIDEQEEQKESHKEWILKLSASFEEQLKGATQSFTQQIEQVKKQLESSNETLIEQITSQIMVEKNNRQEEEPAKEEEKKKEEQEEEKKEEMPAQKMYDQGQVKKQLIEIESLKRDLAVIRQLDRERKEETSQIIQEIRAKAASLTKANEQDIKVISARSALEEGKKGLLEKSDKITTRLEELQDTIDQLKLDVTQRKCRPSEIQMTHCAKERRELSKDIEEFGAFIAQVKPKWKKTWEHELQTIVKEQQTLKDQEYLLTDIKDDLEALSEVFEQLEKIYAYQASAKPVVREFRVVPAEDGHEGMSSVLKQVATIDVDHERRLRAMEQADKMRQRELANRIDDFEKELVTFVDTKKLKKTGGALEIDRLRKQKDEEILKQIYASKAAGSNTNNNQEQPPETEPETEEVEASEA
ncbi:AIP3-domain-containing protein [Rhizopus microsporus ATCC 52813]|uniref:AIP3-domain-containing protein n=1 Tax=Rhizopus microsporus ATCC 52813 TaxID=1340429 RepID=A0A2G4SVA4_RHIZD|nr:AIP3-domain-containing protein [Rhizopus microsporus ATCC 52813]PHZ12674.1 AIP3-domain-containing protein [Rhizopus microsporus ATCC 52813]